MDISEINIFYSLSHKIHKMDISELINIFYSLSHLAGVMLFFVCTLFILSIALFGFIWSFYVIYKEIKRKKNSYNY